MESQTSQKPAPSQSTLSKLASAVVLASASLATVAGLQAVKTARAEEANKAAQTDPKKATARVEADCLPIDPATNKVYIPQLKTARGNDARVVSFDFDAADVKNPRRRGPRSFSVRFNVDEISDTQSTKAIGVVLYQKTKNGSWTGEITITGQRNPANRFVFKGSFVVRPGADSGADLNVKNVFLNKSDYSITGPVPGTDSAPKVTIIFIKNWNIGNKHANIDCDVVTPDPTCAQPLQFSSTTADAATIKLCLGDQHLKRAVYSSWFNGQVIEQHTVGFEPPPANSNGQVPANYQRPDGSYTISIRDLTGQKADMITATILTWEYSTAERKFIPVNGPTFNLAVPQ